MSYTPNTFINTLVVLIAAVFGGQIEIPSISFILLKINTTPYVTQLYIFLIKCGQSAVFAAIGYLVKLGFDYYVKDKIFPTKNKTNQNE